MNEFTVELGGEEFELRFTPRALVALEKYLGSSVFSFVSVQSNGGGTRLMEIEVLGQFVFQGIKHQLKDGRAKDERTLDWVIDNLPLGKFQGLIEVIVFAVLDAYGIEVDAEDPETVENNGAAKKKKGK
jgi:hypothetical protein